MRTVLVALLLLVGLSAPSYAAAQPVTEPQPLPTGTDVDYQLGGPAYVPDNVGIVVRDRTAEPAPGAYNICYVNGFQTQPDAKAYWRKHRDLLLQDGNGRLVEDEAWGEWLFDVRTKAKREKLASIVGRWTRGCARDGFAAVEYDNLDSFSRSRGLLKAKHAKAFARLLTAGAHDAGLAVGQKNWATLDGTRLGFDFAVSEECGRYDECGDYVEHFGDQVLVIEYRAQDFARTCDQWGPMLSVVLRDLDLSPDGVRRWC